MEDIKWVLNELSEEEIKEMLLSCTGSYSPDDVSINYHLGNKDIEIISCGQSIKDTFYGRKIEEKYYFARHKAEMLDELSIDYYDEFFSHGTELEL